MFGDAIISFFSSFGGAGMVSALFFIFIIDSMFFPTLPEFFLLVIYSTNPTFSWGITLIFVALLSIFFGNTLLYLTVEKFGLPSFIKKFMKKYSNVMIARDEKMLLINRIAPVLPYTGAFISVNNWDYKKSILYILAGGIAKFSLLIFLSGFFYTLFEKGLAQKATFWLIIVTIILGLILSYIRKREIYGKRVKE
ncbi:MAG TPA: hypothetical protein ENI33_04425 [Thermoplasmatales archaeon]|nr:hypothetical protein [Thermoplasmatales archaeon]